MIKTNLDFNVNLIEYLPHFLRDNSHLKQIAECENPEFDMVYKFIKKVLFNEYIISSDIDGIKRFEKLLNINVDESQSLEVRKFNIISKWGGELPYTHRNLINKLDILCGKNNYTLEINNNEYIVNIITSIIDVNKKNIILDTLREIIPANMIIINDNRLTLKLYADINIGMSFSQNINYRIGG